MSFAFLTTRRAFLAGLSIVSVQGCDNEESVRKQRVIADKSLDRPASITDDFSSIAISPDGKYMAVNLFLRPTATIDHFCDLAIIDLDELTGWLISGPTGLFLTYPTFSPDGQSIAFIGTPPRILGYLRFTSAV